MGWTPAQIIEATGAHPGGPAARELTSISTDTRSIAPGALFIALRGPRHDGHDFAAEALRRGAQAVLVERVPPDVGAADALVVPDTLRALGDLAAWTRRRHPVRVAAITGSNGKTTTKEMLASICEHVEWRPPRTRVLKTAGTENNLIGVPLTLLRLAGDEAVAVLEMGMNAPGEIARLTQIASPDVGVITNIGPAHLEGLGSVAGVAAAKGELFAGMSPRATIVVNVADEWVRRVASGFSGRRVEIGPGCEVEALNVTDLGFDGTVFDLRLAGEIVPVRLSIPGAHMVSNALAAAGAAHALGVAGEAIRAGLEAVTPPPMRMQVRRLANGVTIVNDAYNANPASMEAALRFITRRAGPAVAVLGEMRELGAEAAALHRQVGKVAAECGVRLLVAVGEHAEDVARGALAGGMAAADVQVCGDPATAAAAVIAAWRAGDAVLVKGSRGAADDPLVQERGARMAEVVRLLEEAGSRP
jgi:UDP-N-acetylmuramoyl-tripeptide--D-alanyl-D-alanine ligase